MKKLSVTIAAMWLAITGTGHAQEPNRIELGLYAALYACEQWILEPAKWADSIENFPTAIGLEDVMKPSLTRAEVVLPPPVYRVDNHFWEVAALENSGYLLVVSSSMPMCHITGGAEADMNPAVESFLASEAFNGSWKKASNLKTSSETVTDQFINVEEPQFTVVITRVINGRNRPDRLQFVATAVLVQ